MENTTTKKTVFETLNAINVNEHTEKKMGLTYLSWAWAWAEVKHIYPHANYEICESQNGINYFTDGKTAWVKVIVRIEDETVTEYLPVMDYKNKSIPLNAVTSMDVNKAQKRCLVKALALLGLGLYIYAGEDLPEDCDDSQPVQNPPAQTTQPAQTQTTQNQTVQSQNVQNQSQNFGGQYHQPQQKTSPNNRANQANVSSAGNNGNRKSYEKLQDLINDYSERLANVKLNNGQTYLSYVQQYVGTQYEKPIIEDLENNFLNK